MKMYEVGGCVRDGLLGVTSKDIDFTVVLEPGDTLIPGVELATADPFMTMVAELKQRGFKIFLETPEFLTVRAQFPNLTIENGKIRESRDPRRRMTADFVLARKEEDYTDGRRPDKVVPGTLEDDLARRDFTMNAIAKDSDGTLIDPYNGRSDILMRQIRAVGDPMERLTEDALRAVRALRFSVTKGFRIDPALAEAMESYPVWRAIQDKISDERIQVELSKMFRFDTIAALRAMDKFPALSAACFHGRVSLDATLKTKGRGNG